ncbi:hypothetical protein NMG60_11022330 [Bertholletia excelsa]
MGRAPCCDKFGLKKGPWTPEEDQRLIDYIQKHGYGNWRTLPKNAGLQRCGKSCRLRWTNYLRPDIKRGKFSFEEEEAIIHLHSILGNKWSAIAARLPGRTDNEIKNYWNTHIRKKLLRMGIDPVTHNPRLDLLDLSSILRNSLYNPSHQMNLSRLLSVQSMVNPELLSIASSLLSSQNANLHGQTQTQLPPLVQVQPDPIQIQAPVQEIPNSIPFSGETQFVEPTLDQFSSGFQMGSDLGEEYVNALQNYGYYVSPSENSMTFQSNNSNDFSFASVMSTLSTPPNSPAATHLNGGGSTTTTTEDEKESYCSSSMLRFEMPDMLGVDQFV